METLNCYIYYYYLLPNIIIDRGICNGGVQNTVVLSYCLTIAPSYL